MMGHGSTLHRFNWVFSHAAAGTGPAFDLCCVWPFTDALSADRGSTLAATTSSLETCIQTFMTTAEATTCSRIQGKQGESRVHASGRCSLDGHHEGSWPL